MNNYYEQDEQLYQAVHSLMSGNADSYYTMYDLSIKYIYKIIYDIVKDYHTTEDLVQETYIIIYNKINTLQDARKFYSWAGRIATNLAYRYMQNNKRELLALDSEDGAAEFIFDVATQDNEEFIPENILMDKERQRLLSEIIDGLSVEQKLAVQYFYYEEMSVSEIAEAMGCTTGTVKSRLNYARKAIKAAVIDLAENQGTKLYSLSALPLFYILFRQAVAEFAFAGATAGVTGVVAGTAAGVTNVVAGTTAGATNVVAGVGTEVAATVSKGIFGKIGTSIGAKIVAGVVATSLVIGGGVAVHNLVTDKKDDTTAVTIEEVVEATDTEEGKQLKRRTTYLCSDGQEQMATATEYIYGDYGRECYYRYDYDLNGNVTSTREAKHYYNDSGRVTKLEIYEEGSFLYDIDIECDENGNPIKYEYTDEGVEYVEEYEYHENGKDKSFKIYEDGRLVVDVEYDEFGNEINYKNYEDGVLESEEKYEVKYEYDEGGKVIIAKSYLDGALHSESQYDEDEDIVVEYGYHDDGTTMFKITYEYVMDEATTDTSATTTESVTTEAMGENDKDYVALNEEIDAQTIDPKTPN